MMYIYNALLSTIVLQGVSYQLNNIEMRLNKIVSFLTDFDFKMNYRVHVENRIIKPSRNQIKCQ